MAESTNFKISDNVSLGISVFLTLSLNKLLVSRLITNYFKDNYYLAFFIELLFWILAVFIFMTVIKWYFKKRKKE